MVYWITVFERMEQGEEIGGLSSGKGGPAISRELSQVSSREIGTPGGDGDHETVELNGNSVVFGGLARGINGNASYPRASEFVDQL